jgi:UPF0176 protein
VNHLDKTVVGKEWFDGTPCERYINCSNPECNKQILVSEENEARYLGACSHECAKCYVFLHIGYFRVLHTHVSKRLNNALRFLLIQGFVV